MTVEALAHKCLKSLGVPIYLDEKNDNIDRDVYIVYLFDGELTDTFADGDAKETEVSMVVHLYCLKTDPGAFNLKRRIKKTLAEYGFSQPEVLISTVEERYRHIALATNITVAEE